MLTDQTELNREQALSYGRSAIAQLEKSALGPSNGSVPVFDPSTGRHIWDLPEASDQEIDSRVIRAKHAQASWQAKAPGEKADTLFACAEALKPLQKQLSLLIAVETGKALSSEATAEPALVSRIFSYFAGLCHENKGKSFGSDPGLLGFTTHHPWGLVAGVVPWNMPLMFGAYKIAAPLAVGNAVILKAPEQGTAALSMMLSAMEPHLPEGLVQMITGTGLGAGNSLINHPGVDKISFTGSASQDQLHRIS